jgi:hypothetical protein
MVVLFVATIFLTISIVFLMPSLYSYRIKGDAQAIAGLVAVARMRAEANFAHSSVVCSTATPYSCQVQVTTSGAGSAVTEPLQKILSSGVSFLTTFTGTGVPTIGAGNQSTPTENLTMNFNSRGLPVDTSGNLVSNYAVYLTSTDGRYYAVALQANGQPIVYNWVGSQWVLTQ